MVYVCPIGSRGGMNYLFFEKSVFVKHPNIEALVIFVQALPSVIIPAVSPPIVLLLLFAPPKVNEQLPLHLCLASCSSLVRRSNS